MPSWPANKRLNGWHACHRSPTHRCKRGLTDTVDCTRVSIDRHCRLHARSSQQAPFLRACAKTRGRGKAREGLAVPLRRTQAVVSPRYRTSMRWVGGTPRALSPTPRSIKITKSQRRKRSESTAQTKNLILVHGAVDRYPFGLWGGARARRLHNLCKGTAEAEAPRGNGVAATQHPAFGPIARRSARRQHRGQGA